MRIAGYLQHSSVNGDGVRFVIFTQGCNHRCPGCQNPETWDPHKGTDYDVRVLADIIKATKYIDGITLSGGDPWYQQEECCRLLDLLPGVNVWAYTGFEWDEVKDTPLAGKCDVVVTGPYIEALRCEGKMYGSSNQEIHRKE